MTEPIMDIDLLSKMVYDLILENDRVALPGVGCFVAEIVPASFSDKGYTINPPYRRLYFRTRPDDGELLVDLYSKSNGVPVEDARRIITDFLSEMKKVLLSRKVIVFPGLGRLRATRENNIFFVADEALDIYPEGFGLQSLSLKTHKETEQELSSAMDEIGDILACAPAAEVASVASAEPVSAATAQAIPEPAPEAIQEDSAEPVSELAPEPAPEQPAETDAEPSQEFSTEPTPEPAPEPIAEPTTEPTPELVAEPTPGPVPEPVQEPVSEPTPAKHMSKGWKTALIAALSTAAAAALLLGTYLLLARFCPDFIDSILYTAEELEILNYPL